MVLPTHVRRRALKHAFEEALDAVLLEPDGEPMPFEGETRSLPHGVGPAVGSLGDIAVAPGYVASSSLARAYGAEAGSQSALPERPGEAADKLKAALATTSHTARDLMRLRRRFAAQNHPDRVPTALRDEAVAAMAEVNAEIDRALKRAASS